MQTFLEIVLPTQGAYCSVSIKDEKVKPTFHTTVADVEAQAQADFQRGADAYFAVASFADPTKGRNATNAVYVRSFFLDIDAGPNKPYADAIDAANALRVFTDTTGLPPPTIVSSGNGLHVYWPLDQDLPKAVWLPHARRLKELCKAHKLYIDPTVTADAARILRVPGTGNCKHTPPKPVQVAQLNGPYKLEDIVACLPAAAPPPLPLAAAKQFGGVDQTTKDIAAEDHQPSKFSRIVQRSLNGGGCAQIKHAVLHSNELEEPLWRAVLSIAVRCEDGASAIHKVSKAHPGYSAEATERKAAETKGPYTCSWYKDNAPEHCKGCKENISSPIVLGRIVKAAETVGEAYVIETTLEPGQSEPVKIEIPEYPFPYFRGAKGGVFRRIRKDDVEMEEEIYPRDLYITHRFFDSDEHGEGDGEIVGINLHMQLDGVRRFFTKTTDLFAKDALRDLLIKNGAIAYGKHLDQLMAYFASSIRKLQSQYAASRTHHQMGWTSDKQGFVVGELEYTATGTKLAPPSSSTRQLAPAFKSSGSLDEWRNIVNFYNTPGMEAHALAVFFGFGAPLLKLIGGETVKGALIHLKSNASGTGKTTVQLVVNSIFGHPSALMLTKQDTFVSKMHLLGMMNSIAFTLDEITNLKDEELSELSYGVTTGRDKHRMKSNENKLRTNNSDWSTFVISSANGSMIDKMAQLKSTADGEMRRLLEIEVPRPRNINKQEVNALFSKLSSNYGVAGPIYIKYVLANIEPVIEKLKEVMAKIDSTVGFEQNDRFHSCVLACGFVGALIAKNLGLHDIEIPRVYNYAIDVVKQNKMLQFDGAGGAAVIAQETLSSFINENINNVLVINSAVRGAVPPAPIVSPRQSLKMRYEPDNRELFITVSDFRSHFAKRQVDVRESVKLLAAAGVIKDGGRAEPKRIGAGAVGGMVGLSVRCYRLDGDALGVSEASFTHNGQETNSTPDQV